jgi:murein DD-endopeptidase MepM/ murein hydrolase activator NlpD
MRVLACSALLLLAGCSSLENYQPRTYVVASGDTLYSIAWRHGVDHRDLARWNELANPNRISIGQRLVLAPRGGAPPASRQISPGPAPNLSRPTFSWPTQGTIAARFGDRGILTTGIGIAGREGQDVIASASGRVVYAGGGLADYGQLVIIEHNESWLTAYGHNRRLLVAQGQTIGRGQKIAEMGLGPAREPRLYFEIRQNGDPLNPLRLLPGSG